MALVLSHFEALEQTLRLRLVSGPVDKKVFLMGNSLSHTVGSRPLETTCTVANTCTTKFSMVNHGT